MDDEEAPDAASHAGPPAEPRAPAAPDYKDLFLRASAELENYRKRLEREKASLLQFASEGVVRRLLEPYDSFGRAVADLARVHAEAPKEMKAALSRSLEGLRALERQLGDALSAEGVELIHAQGEEFDPAFHEALVRVPHKSLPAGTVVEVLQPGYIMRGRVLRPARVAVSAGGAEEAPAVDSAGAANVEPPPSQDPAAPPGGAGKKAPKP